MRTDDTVQTPALIHRTEAQRGRRVGRGRFGVTLACVAVAALVTGCGSEPGDELEARECLFVYSATGGNDFDRREVPVCGSIMTEPDGVTRLTDFVHPSRYVRLALPADAAGDPAMSEALQAVEALRRGERRYFEARFHGRLEVRAGEQNVLHVSRVDWIGGEPGTRR